MGEAWRLPPAKGRGAGGNPANRFEALAVEPDAEWLEHERHEHPDGPRVATRCYDDTSRTVLAKNDSPDVPFDYSVNPYRGCEHGCSYCYARPTHEYLGFSAGLDFESRIMVKRDAPELLARAFRSRSWVPQVVALSGNTDCYQPVERQFRITRRLLQTFLEFRNPVGLITKSALVLRDLDVLRELAALELVHVTLSVTTLDPALARAMEPRAATPARRLEALAALSEAGIRTAVNVAPVVPGLNDHEIPAILAEAAARGVAGANWIMLRLAGAVRPLFVDWLETHYPARRDKVLRALEAVRAGRLNDPRFGSRLKGEGVRAEAIAALFDLHRRRLGLDRKHFDLRTDRFRRDGSAQQELALE